MAEAKSRSALRRVWVVAVLATALALWTPAVAQEPLRLHRGINVSFWRSGAPRAFTGSDARLLRDAGFDFVRLQVYLGGAHRCDSSAAALMRELNQMLETLSGAGLSAVLNAHVPGERLPSILADSVALELHASDLIVLARLVRERPANSVALELLNEPVRPPGAGPAWDWNALQRGLWAAVRSVNPRVTIIATGDDGSSVAGLLRVTPLPDTNVIYTFHYYLPHLFTHQGAWWMRWPSEAHQKLRRVPYPVDSAAIEVSAAASLEGARTAADSAMIVSVLRAFGAHPWNRSRIERDIAAATAWASQHRVRLLAGEFGVFANYADAPSRAAWLRDVRVALDAKGIPWAMWRYWDYGRGFGLLVGQDTLDVAVLGALGLPH